ncbi:MAG: DUF4439 domain-containing protein [Blastocatellia bacterium]
MNAEKSETMPEFLPEFLKDLANDRTSRRTLLSRFAGTASAGVIGCLLSGTLRPAYGQTPEGDLGILLAALYLEHEAIAAYQAGAESKLLSEGVLKVAVAFQSDHKYHRGAIVGAIRTLGGQPIEPEKKYGFGSLKNEKDILRLAQKLEKGAVDAYSLLAANIQNKDVLNFGAQAPRKSMTNIK